MRRRTRDTWRQAWLMLGAVVFVLQLLLGTAMAAGAAASPRLDAFGNPLCLADVVDKGDTGHAGDHGSGKFAGCCGVACSMVFSGLAPSPLPAPLHPAVAALAAPERGLSRGVRTVLRPETDPENPRAPPSIL
ncbi:DUF2946 family protein [Rhizobium sp. CC-YZS058]|uniref:DUF2946 family protein n=1 Tax=Rhizobium sp. CC-YZS058 TaxID=3042153 RepID=UPI002B061D86|nr:DUF2946 family protein [Rhizobium sp. CC-YZS058]MEA3534309.1 hypothetical protein [Rhizobium sp. CC-YZS058]